MGLIKIEEIMRMSKEELESINLHITPIANITGKDGKDGIDVKGIKAEKKENSIREVNDKVFFTQGLNGVLQMVNHSFKKLYERKTGDYVHNSENNKEIQPEIANEIFVTVKKILEGHTYYLLGLKGCKRAEYEELSSESKSEIDYLSDDYDEEFFEEDANGNRTIPDPNHLVIPSNMHTISGQGVSVDKVNRIVYNDGSAMNAFDTLMNLCQKYKELNPDMAFPIIMNDGYNWLEGFYQSQIQQIFSEQKIGKSTIDRPIVNITQTENKLKCDQHSNEQEIK